MKMILDIVVYYFKELYTVFMSMAPYFFIGLTFAGVLHVLMKKEFIVRHLQKDTWLSVVKAALLGVPLPLCSCGVVPTALSLRRNKASEGATLAFLISTPQTGVDSIIATYGLLGIVFAAFTPFAALCTGIAGGLMTLVWRENKPTAAMTDNTGFDCNICFERNPHRHSIFEKLRGMAVYAYKQFLDDISVRLIIGIALSALITLVVPDDFFSRYVGNDFLSMLLMIAIGIPLYICATASIPIALAMIDKGLSPGAAFVFLTVGPATNAATITLIASTMGKRIVTIYLGVIASMAIVNGTILNFIFKFTGAPRPAIASAHHGHHMHASSGHVLLPIVLATAFAVILTASLFRRAREWFVPLIARFTAKPARPGETDELLFIEGMTCVRCQAKVTNALMAIPGVRSATVDLKSHTAKIRSTVSREQLIKAVADAGYQVREDGIK